MERGRIQGLPKFFEYPLLSQERVNLYELQIWQVHCDPSEQKPIKNFGEKAAWVYPGTAQTFVLSQDG